MKSVARFFLMFSMVVLLNAHFPQVIIETNINPSVQNKENVFELIEEDCYTYERVYINGQWWIYVYDCEGILINVHLEDED